MCSVPLPAESKVVGTGQCGQPWLPDPSVHANMISVPQMSVDLNTFPLMPQIFEPSGRKNKTNTQPLVRTADGL